MTSSEHKHEQNGHSSSPADPLPPTTDDPNVTHVDQSIASQIPEALIEFPCLFPLKVIGHNVDEFADEVHTLLLNFFPELSRDVFSANTSSTGKYVSLTITIFPESMDQLHLIYAQLKAHRLVVMTM